MTLPELIKEIKIGNKVAEQYLFNQLRRRYLVLCVRYVKNKEDAEERMLDGFYKFFNTIEAFTYRHDDGLYAWIKKIMINECLMQLRSKSIFSITTENEAHDISEQENILDKLSTAEIFKLIIQLPLGYRTVFNLFVIDGMEHEEIASELGITKGSSKSQLSKARSLLQKMILSNGTEYVKQQSK